jgi:hypothetical protein
MLHENTPKQDEQRLKELLGTFSLVQLRYMVERMYTNSDKDAAMSAGISAETVKHWDNKAEVDEAVTLMRFDGVQTALEIRRRSLAKAMAVKADGLDYNDKRLRQSVATEMVEWELGRPTQPHQLEGNVNLKIDGLTEALSKVYGGNSDSGSGSNNAS